MELKWRKIVDVVFSFTFLLIFNILFNFFFRWNPQKWRRLITHAHILPLKIEKKKRLNVLHLCYNISITNVVDPWTSNKFMKTRLLCVHTKHFFFRIRLGLRWINILYNKTKIDKMSFERWDSMLMVVDVILTLNLFHNFFLFVVILTKHCFCYRIFFWFFFPTLAWLLLWQSSMERRMCVKLCFSCVSLYIAKRRSILKWPTIFHVLINFLQNIRIVSVVSLSSYFFCYF